MSKPSARNSKVCCDRYRKHFNAPNIYDNSFKKVKRVVISKKNICGSLREDETCSMGSLCHHKQNKVQKNTTKSDMTFIERYSCKKIVDCCKKCGDMNSDVNIANNESKVNKQDYGQNSRVVKEAMKTSTFKNIKDKKHIHQFYKNERFHESSDSFYPAEQTKCPSLKTIIEHPEKSCSTHTVFKIPSYDCGSEDDFLDPDNIDNIQKLKQFRTNNYFECHSAKSRIRTKDNASGLNHKCIYRFYLNDRLFPVPVYSDHHENVRCMECQLPLNIKDEQNSVNGTIQAKVKLNNEVQDMLLMLPVKNSLIIQERRKDAKKEEDSLCFGIIKLNLNGDSIFNRNKPDNSLALRYQKGYEEHSRRKEYNYQSLLNDDVIIV